MVSKYLAIDLGAESGRALVGLLKDGKLTTEVVHRFPTQGLVINGTRQWDITRIYSEIIRGITMSVRAHGSDFKGVSIDTWGVDFALVDKTGTLLGNPVHYRDHRNDGMAQLVSEVVPNAELYKRTGIVSLPFNTIFQMYSMVRTNAPTLAVADKLLFVGCLLGYWLSGKPSCEYTIASTGAMLRAGSMEWDEELMKTLGIPTAILPEVSAPGTVLGPLQKEVVEATGIDTATPFISGAVHDTAAAVVAVPYTGTSKNWAYLSSGTWSLLGAELDKPHVSDASLKASFTNEGGVNGTIRFLKNIIGLWIIQECRRAWVTEANGSEDGLNYGTLAAEAASTEAFRSIINLEDGRLLAPPNMPTMLRTLCEEAGEPIPRTHGEVIRCAMESLALCYRKNLQEMDAILNRKTDRLHIIGGGANNALLNQMTADACGIDVYAGPTEATAIGNIMVQAMATGEVSDLAAARRIVAASSKIEIYHPRDTAAWEKAAARIKK